ncbi:PCRF domain-containing protein, partial [Mycobacterium tuberculosis]|nr:PCRF domain-containing protein [Mycobacterium tuberculosis]
LTRRYSELDRIVAAAKRVDALGDDLAAAEELSAEDPDLAAEAERLRTEQAEAEAELRDLLVPRDPDDARDAIVEIKAGEGGDESALFAG